MHESTAKSTLLARIAPRSDDSLDDILARIGIRPTKADETAIQAAAGSSQSSGEYDEWSCSVDPTKPVVCVWVKHLREVGGVVFEDIQIRNLMKFYKNHQQNSELIGKLRTFESTLLAAYKARIAVTVVLMDGESTPAPYGSPSMATRKALDHLRWHVTNFSEKDRTFRLQRDRESFAGNFWGITALAWLRFKEKHTNPGSFIGRVIPGLGRRSIISTGFAILAFVSLVAYVAGDLIEKKDNLLGAFEKKKNFSLDLDTKGLRADEISEFVIRLSVDKGGSGGGTSVLVKRPRDRELDALYEHIEAGELVSNDYRVAAARLEMNQKNYSKAASLARETISHGSKSFIELGLLFKAQRELGRPVTDYSLVSEFLAETEECLAQQSDSLAFNCRVETYAAIVKQLEFALDAGLYFHLMAQEARLKELSDEYRSYESYESIEDRRDIASLRARELALLYVYKFDLTGFLADEYLEKELAKWNTDPYRKEISTESVHAVIAVSRESLKRRYLLTPRLVELLVSTFSEWSKVRSYSTISGAERRQLVLATADFILLVHDLYRDRNTESAIETISRGNGVLGKGLRDTIYQPIDQSADVDGVALLVDLAKTAISYAEGDYLTAFDLAQAIQSVAPAESAVWWEATEFLYSASLLLGRDVCIAPLPDAVERMYSYISSAYSNHIICLARACRLEEARDKAAWLNSALTIDGDLIGGRVRVRSRVVEMLAPLQLATGRAAEAASTYEAAIKLWTAAPNGNYLPNSLVVLGRGWSIAAAASGDDQIQKSLENAFLLNVHTRGPRAEPVIYGSAPFLRPPKLCNPTDIRGATIELNTLPTGTAINEFGTLCPYAFGDVVGGDVKIWTDATRYFLVSKDVPDFWVPWKEVPIKGNFGTIRRELNSCPASTTSN